MLERENEPDRKRQGDTQKEGKNQGENLKRA